MTSTRALAPLRRVSPDDELHVFGMIGVVVDTERRFRAVFVCAGDKVISSLTLPRFIQPGPCTNCSRLERHRVSPCPNPGARPPRAILESRREKRS